jgi:hypothetical protein
LQNDVQIYTQQEITSTTSHKVYNTSSDFEVDLTLTNTIKSHVWIFLLPSIILLVHEKRENLDKLKYVLNINAKCHDFSPQQRANLKPKDFIGQHNSAPTGECAFVLLIIFSCCYLLTLINNILKQFMILSFFKKHIYVCVLIYRLVMIVQ